MKLPSRPPSSSFQKDMNLFILSFDFFFFLLFNILLIIFYFGGLGVNHGVFCMLESSPLLSYSTTEPSFRMCFMGVIFYTKIDSK